MSSEVWRASKEDIPRLRLPEFQEMDCLETGMDMEVIVEPTISTVKVKCPYCGSSEVRDLSI